MNSNSNMHAVEEKNSWIPMVTIALAQVLMSFNVASLPVALSGIVRSFNTPPTMVATAIMTYSLFVAAFVMLGSKLNQRFGSLIVFRYSALLFCIAQVIMTFSTTINMAIIAQGLSGLVAAALVPSLVALIVQNYSGKQQSTALGTLGSARAGAGVAAFLIGGLLGTYVGWRPVFGILIALSITIFILSFRLKNEDNAKKDTQIDMVGVILAASFIIFLTFGFNNLNRWGILQANDMAPFNIFGFSPAPLMVIIGIVLCQAFIAWCRHREDNNKTPLLSLQVMSSSTEKSAVIAMFIVVALEAMLNFTVPLYIQIVQGQTPFATTIAMMPFNLSVFFAATLIVKFFDKISPSTIGKYGFATCTIALLWLAFVVRNDWNEFAVMFGLIIFGLAQGALVTLVFNVLVSSSPKELASDVGSLRGTTSNLANAVGTALAAGLLVALLSSTVVRNIATSPVLTEETETLVNLDRINFVSNDHLEEILSKTSATPEQVKEAVRVNTESRLRALKIGLLIMAMISMLAIIPAGRLPKYTPKELK